LHAALRATPDARTHVSHFAPAPFWLLLLLVTGLA